jgi:PhzF family phenazine biosynthesis protein
MFISVVDAFTNRQFSGNPAAVCLVPFASTRRADAAWMQNVAAEMNLSETAFVSPREDGNFDLRWFTPQVEVDLCGHATLAAAHILWEAKYFEVGETIQFHTRSGVLSATREGERITLDFPSTPPQEIVIPVELEAALGAKILWCGRSAYDIVAEVENEITIRNLQPNFAALQEIEARGIIVTSHADDADVDFVSRFFAPAVGINEDPVTGSAHCALAPFWGRRLNKTQMQARQMSARGGELQVRLEGERVHLLGKAVTTLRGELSV